MEKFRCRISESFISNIPGTIKFYNFIIHGLKTQFPDKDNLFTKKGNLLVHQTEENLKQIIKKYGSDVRYKIKVGRNNLSIKNNSNHGVCVDITPDNGFVLNFNGYKISVSDNLLSIGIFTRTLNNPLLVISCRYNVKVKTFLRLLSLKNENAFKKGIDKIINYYRNQQKEELIKSIITALNAEKDKGLRSTIKKTVERRWRKANLKTKFKNDEDIFHNKITNMRNEIIKEFVSETSSSEEKKDDSVPESLKQQIIFFKGLLKDRKINKSAYKEIIDNLKNIENPPA